MKLYRIREFAMLTGVTVRTLHHYDELGLLQPGQRTSAGYRLYGADDLARLQQIATLKFFGFPLKRITGLLGSSSFDLLSTLRLQREILQRQQRQLQNALTALERAETTARTNGQPDWQDLKNLIEVMNMSEPNEEKQQWVKQHFTPEQLAELAKRDTPEVRQRAQQEWAALIAEVEAAVNDDPAAPHSQQLAERWRSLIEQFTGGNPGIASNLNKVYSNTQSAPQEFKRPWSDAAQTFIAAAIRISKEAH